MGRYRIGRRLGGGGQNYTQTILVGGAANPAHSVIQFVGPVADDVGGTVGMDLQAVQWTLLSRHTLSK